MAIYHCSIKIISRGKGKAVVGSAAYRAGEKIIDDYYGITHDYTRKSGVVHKEILLPEHAPREYSSRAVLWNAVEKIEKASNSQLAREFELALPVELSREQNISLVREYVKNNFVDSGMCADICVHDTKKGNPHAHIMLTTRPFNKDKSWGVKERKDYALDGNGNRIPHIDPETGLQKLDGRNRKQWKRVYIQANDWNDQAKAEEWREAWEDVANAALEKHGHAERIDHRSYERQGIEQIPTIHMGVAATQMERRGIETERGNINREISRINQFLSSIVEKLKQLKDWLKEAVTPATPPTLGSILKGVLENGEQDGNYGKIRNINKAERVYKYMRENGISKISELRDKYSEVHGRYSNARDNLNYYSQRTKTLDENIRQGSIYNKHRELYKAYKELKPRKQPKFYETHRTDLMLFEAARRYFKEQYISTNFSIKDWKEEKAKLPAERAKVYREYKVVETEFTAVETARLDAEQIVRELNAPPQRSTRSRDWSR